MTNGNTGEIGQKDICENCLCAVVDRYFECMWIN